MPTNRFVRKSRKVNANRRYHVHSKSHSRSKKKKVPFSGSRTSKHHSSTKSNKSNKSKEILSTNLKPAGRGHKLRKKIALERAKMNSLIDDLSGMNLSAAADRKVDRLGDILDKLQKLDVRSLSERRRSKLKSRKK